MMRPEIGARRGIRVALGLLALLVAPPLAAEQEITLGASFWPPYADPRLPGQGLALSIVTAAFERAGYQPTVELAAWERTFENGRTGALTVVAAMWKNSERERDFLFSAPYLENSIKLLKLRKDEISVDRLEDLDGLRVGVVHAYTYGEDFDRAQGFVRVPESHVLANLLQLLAGDVDLAVGDERTLRYEIARHLHNRRGELDLLAREVGSQSLRIGVSRRHPEAERIIADFDQAIGELVADGSHRKLSRQANEEIWRQTYLPR